MNRLLLLLIAGVGLAVVLGTASGDGTPAPPRSYQVYPDQQIPLIFSHSRHQQTGISCVVCHCRTTP